MTRHARLWTASAAVLLSLFAAPAAIADDAASDPDPTATPSPPTSTPPAAADGGAVDEGGDVTLPNPDAPSTRSPRVLVFGDSMSATRRYSVAGTSRRPKAWWAYVAEGAGVPASHVMVSAEGGSGLLVRGNGEKVKACSGTTFGDRLSDVAATDPDVIIVEVGRNDVRICRGGKRVNSTGAERRAAATKYFNALARAADRQGIPRSFVYVMTPWGSSGGAGKVATATLYETFAKSHGFTWVTLPSLVRAQTTDAIHPTATGSKSLATWAMRSSDVTTAIRTRAARHAAVPSRAKVLCSGTGACRRSGVSAHQYSKATSRIWGTKPGSPAHYAAHRLTAGNRRTAPVLTASTPRAWRTSVTATGSAKQVAEARRGDVAWWPTAPAGVGASKRGHVAVVESVARNNSYVVVTELTSTGTFRSVRYAGTSYPRAFLRFATTDGSPRGVVTGAGAKAGVLVVRGRAVDTDAPQAGVRIRVTVTQGKRTWTRTATRTKFTFEHRFSVSGLRTGPASVKVKALNAPKTRGTTRTLATRRVVVR